VPTFSSNIRNVLDTEAEVPAAVVDEGGAVAEVQHSRLYVWNSGTLQWERMTQPGGGGGGGGIVQQGARDVTAQAWHVDDNGGSLTVDGTVTANAGTGPWPVTDNAGSLTVDAPVGTPVWVRLSDGSVALVGQKTMANSLPVTIASDQSAVPVSDGGGSLTVDGTFWQATQPVSLATNTPDVTDRAAREVGRVRLWDGTDEATIMPLRTAPASTEKVLNVREIPNRLATFNATIATQTPAITIGVKELLALWHASTGTKDIYIVEVWVAGLVTAASTTGGRTTVRISTITTAPTGGVAITPVDTAGGTSDMTNTMQVKTGGGTIGTTFLRKPIWHATQAIGSAFTQSIFQASNPGNGLILPAGSNGGISIDIEREVAHTALVDVWTVGARWLEI